MKSILKKLVILILIIITLLCVGISVYASDDVFTYDDYGDYYVITGYNGELSGEIVIPSTHNGLPVYEIGEYAFDGCTGITGITVEDGIEVIWNGAFANCGVLDFVTIPDSVIYMEEGIFYNCSIDKLTIPFTGIDNSMTGKQGCISYMFDDPDYRYEVENPDILVRELVLTNETFINRSEFFECKSLESITLNEGISYIGAGAFESCTSLKSVSFPDSVTTIDSGVLDESLYYNDKSNWKDGILYCGKHIICADSDIEKADILDDTITIGAKAFYCCENITDVVIPDSVKYINLGAFSGCIRLQNITIGNDLESIGRDVFVDTHYYINESNWQDGLLYLGDWLIDAKEDITSATIKDGTLYIADSIFYNSAVQSVVMPDSVIKMGDSIFGECNMLEDVRLSTSITEIPIETFYYCINLKEISIPDNVEYIGNYAFGDCDNLTDVKLSKNLKIIGRGVFYGCTNLKEIQLPENLEYIESAAFANTGIEDIIIPESVIDIGTRSFAYCENLKTATLYNDATYLSSIFRDCLSLEKVAIYGNVEKIIDSFEGCISLKEIIFPKTVMIIKERPNFPDGTVFYGYTDTAAEWEAENYGATFIPLDGDVNIENLSASINEDKIDVKIDFSQKYMVHKVLVGLYSSDNSLLGISSVEPCGDNSISFDNNVKASFVKVFVMKSPLNLIPVASKSMNISK